MWFEFPDSEKPSFKNSIHTWWRNIESTRVATKSLNNAIIGAIWTYVDKFIAFFTIDQAIAMCCVHSSRPYGPFAHHPCHYHPLSKGLPLFLRSLHLGLAHVRDLLRTKASIYLCLESLGLRHIDSSVLYVSLYLFLVGRSQRQEIIVRLNLFFGIVGHFRLLKGITIAL
mgnify:CR=1 FL=1